MGRLDLESRLGKAPGGYNMPLPETGIPFVFMNHACLEYDVRVLVHEAGHAVHSFLSHELSHDWMKDTPWRWLNLRPCLWSSLPWSTGNIFTLILRI